MNILSLLTSGKDYITIVKEFIEKVFVHEAKKFKCNTDDIALVLHRETKEDGEHNIIIVTFSKTENKALRVIPDNEVQEILMK